MANSPPKDPQADDTYINDAGEMSCWTGERWERKVPQDNDIWLKDSGELCYWDGEKRKWVPYEDLPESPGGDPAPMWVYKNAK
jgi:hypothetical protein